jgi:hypothetical protein
MRHKLISVVGLALMLSLFSGASIAMAAGPDLAAPLGEVHPFTSNCASGHACVFTGTFYTGAKGESLCTGGAHPLEGGKHSGQVACANKAVWFRQSGTTSNCGNPGAEIPSFVFNVNEIWVGAEGSRC